MSDTLIFARHEAPVQPQLEAPTAPLHHPRSFAHALETTAPVVEVLEAVATDFRQSESSMLSIINGALSNQTVSRAALLTLRARMRRYSFEVDALSKLVQALVAHLRDYEDPLRSEK